MHDHPLYSVSFLLIIHLYEKNNIFTVNYIIRIISYRTSLIVTISIVLGMHRKSLEAAEALKNDDSGTSDREETTSKTSDVSSSNGSSIKKGTNNQNTGNSNPNISVDVQSNHSITPTSISDHTLTSPTTTSNNHQMSIMDCIRNDREKSPMNTLQHPPNYHPENDHEAFRWVDYNRDPISFIRCEFMFFTISIY